MSPRRINPRHVTNVVHVATATPSSDGVTSTLEPAVQVPCQAEFTHQLVATDDGPLITGVLKVRVPPRAARDELQIFTLDSSVTFKGSTSWVLSVSPVERAGVISHTLVVTGDRTDRYGGAWPVRVRVTPSQGRDKWGDPLPTGPAREVAGWLKPGKTSEPVDFDQAAETTATLYVAGSDPITARDRIDVLDSPLAGRWAVDGDPHPEGAALAVPLRRSA